MRPVFADTAFWIAFLDRKASCHKEAVGLFGAPMRLRVVTTDAVLGEVLTFFSEGAPHVRRAVAGLVRRLDADPGVRCLAADHALFLDAVGLYERRPDKTYSLTDCLSMVLMRELGLTEVLTTDRHFVQEGFVVLLPTA